MAADKKGGCVLSGQRLQSVGRRAYHTILQYKFCGLQPAGQRNLGGGCQAQSSGSENERGSGRGRAWVQAWAWAKQAGRLVAGVAGAAGAGH